MTITTATDMLSTLRDALDNGAEYCVERHGRLVTVRVPLDNIKALYVRRKIWELEEELRMPNADRTTVTRGQMRGATTWRHTGKPGKQAELWA